MRITDLGDSNLRFVQVFKTATSAIAGYIPKGQIMFGAVNGDDFGDAVALRVCARETTE